MDSVTAYTFEDYLNCTLFDVHKWSDYPEVLAVRKKLIEELGFTGTKKEVNHVTVVLLNLYYAYSLDPEMWVLFSRARNDYNEGKRYNKPFIKYDKMIKTVDGLLKLEYIEHAKGFQDRKTGKAFDSRMKATTKLIDLIEKDHAVTFEMIGKAGPDELIVLRNADGEDIDYVDTPAIIKMRTELEQYNNLLRETYIDIHFEVDDIQDRIDRCHRKKDKKTGLPRDYRLNICLANKTVRRIFNRSTFNLGGRYYGGWWQNIPSKLRPKIILNTNYTVEIDYSGLHIYMLYALEGINFADLWREPYIYPKDNDPDNLRPIVKTMLLAAVNSGSEELCIKATRYEINMNRQSYPDELPDLKELYQKLKDYHPEIAEYFCSKKGLMLQRWDSAIAEDVVRVMTGKRIPVLVMHDSFICPKGEEQFLEEVMLKVYQHHATKLEIADRFSTSPIATKSKDITDDQPELLKEEDIFFDCAGRLDSPQVRRFIRYTETQDPTTNVMVKVINSNITEVGYDLKAYEFKESDFTDKELLVVS